MDEFIEFPKIPRFSREIIITEKIDGTNAVVLITESGDVIAGSRNRWITPENDNHGFAKWVEANKQTLLLLGVGRHFGEWWGSGIQRSYGLKEKVFSLFNTTKWQMERPSCCSIVPVLYRGDFQTTEIDKCLQRLSKEGSTASSGFMRPEGIVIFHTQGNILFKKTLEKDEMPKSHG